MSFHVGQKVASTITIDSEGFYFPKGFICTVAAVFPVGFQMAFRAVEYDVKPYSFDCAYFRPVVEKGTETGMAILRKLLEGAPIKETVG